MNKKDTKLKNGLIVVGTLTGVGLLAGAAYLGYRFGISEIEKELEYIEQLEDEFEKGVYEEFIKSLGEDV